MEDEAKREFFQWFAAAAPGVLVLLDDASVRGVYAEEGGLFVPAAGYSASSELSIKLSGKAKIYPAAAMGTRSLGDWWAEGVKGAGEGERVTIEADATAAAGRPRYLVVVAGGPFASRSSADSPRPSRLRIGPPGVLAGTEAGASRVVDIGPAEAVAVVALPPEWAGERLLEVRIEETLAGARNQDCAINELIPVYGPR